MLSRWQWLLRQFARRLWVRATLFSMAAAIAALGGIALAPLIPADLSARVGAEAIDNILRILASSMLAVTTFSLTTMVSAYGTVSANVTPRAAKVLRDDTTTQNALGTFIGAFLYSLVGIIALSTGAYGNQGRVVLFAATIVVIGLIVATLLRWIEYLFSLGRVGETTDKVEQATLKALIARAEHPHLGGRPLTDYKADMPPDAIPIFSAVIGYVQYVDVQRLSSCANKYEGQIYVIALPGAFVDPGRPLVRAVKIDEAEALNDIRSAFTIGDERTFDQDPRFGLIVLAEIASRALSPAVNDPGTAIDVIGRAVRILSQWAKTRSTASDQDILYPTVWVPPVRVDDLFHDVFMPIARDGRSLVEVQIRLQKALRALSAIGGEEFTESALRQSRIALARAETGLAMDFDKAAVRQIACTRAAQAPNGGLTG